MSPGYTFQVVQQLGDFGQCLSQPLRVGLVLSARPVGSRHPCLSETFLSDKPSSVLFQKFRNCLSLLPRPAPHSTIPRTIAMSAMALPRRFLSRRPCGGRDPDSVVLSHKAGRIEFRSSPPELCNRPVPMGKAIPWKVTTMQVPQLAAHMPRFQLFPWARSRPSIPHFIRWGGCTVKVTGYSRTPMRLPSPSGPPPCAVAIMAQVSTGNQT